MKRSIGLKAAFALVALSACSVASHHDERLGRQATPVTAECLEELYPSDPAEPGVCSSVWEYVPECHALGVDPECGQSVLGFEQIVTQTPNTCAHPNFGLSNEPADLPNPRDVFRELEGVSAYQTDMGSHDPTCLDWAQWELESLCAEKQVELNGMRCGIDPYVMYVRDVYSVRTDPQYGSIQCKFTITNVPTWKTVTSGQYCGFTTVFEDDPARPIQNACRLPRHPLAPVSECDARPERSERGLTFSTFLSARPKLAEALQSATETRPPEPRCLSCDETPLVGVDGKVAPVAVAKRYKCLTENLARYVLTPGVDHPVAADEGIAADIVRGLKLLVEVHGQHLPADARNSVASLYLRAPAPNCNPAFDDAVRSCRSRIGQGEGGAALASAYGKYLACEALRHHGSGQMVMLDTKACLEATAVVRAAAADPLVAACAAVPPDFEKTLLIAGLGRGVPEVPIAGDPAFDAKVSALQDDLRIRLAAIDAWYSAAADKMDAELSGATDEQAAGLRAALAKDTEAVLGAFWAPLLDVSPTAAAAGRSALEHTATVVERTVLSAAYPAANAPLTHAPLLSVTADALQGLAKHLDAVGAVHDLGCRFHAEGCAGRRSAVSELWDALAKLHDGPALTASLGSATKLGGEPWRAALAAIASGHSALESAARDAHELDPSAPTAPALLRPPSNEARLARAAASFSRFVNEARRRQASYAATGLLSIHGEGEIADALTPEKRALTLGLLETMKGELDVARISYVANTTADLNALAQQIETDRAETVIKGRLETLAKRFDKLTQEIAVLRLRDANEEARFGSFMTSFQKLIDEENARPGYAIQRGLPRTFTLSARDAKFVANSAIPTLEAVMVHEPLASFSVQAGEIVNLRVLGTWSPTCALRGLTLPDGKVLDDATLATLTTGPEGWGLTVTAQGAAVTGQQTTTTDSEFWSKSYSERLCAAAGFTGGLPIAVGPSIGVSAQACEEETHGTSQSRSNAESEGTSQQRQLTAAFASGLRAPGTPFPWAPAGSLIAVVYKPAVDGRTGLTAEDLLDVRVVQAPFTSIVAKTAANITFVVNDSSCGTAVPATPLSIERTSLIPLGAALQQLAAPMGAAVEHIASTRDALVAQGQMLPAESAQLQLDAQQIVAQGCDCDIATLPRFVQQFFASWVGKEITRAERQVSIAAKEFERTLIVTEGETVRAELNANEELARVQALVASLALRHVDSAQLEGKVHDVAEAAVTFVRPALRLRLPNALTIIANDSATQARANALIDLAQSAGSASKVELVSVALAESNFVDSLISNIRFAQLSAPPTSASTVAVRIPRYVDAAPGDTSTTPCVRHPRFFGAQEAPWKALDCAKSRAIWRQVLDTTRERASFNLEPNDVYEGAAGAAPLLCNASAPLISQMAMVVATDDDGLNDTLNPQAWSSRLLLGDRMVFSLTTGPETYRLVPDPFGRGISADASVRFLFSKSESALSAFNTALGQPNGLIDLAQHAGFSPFTTYTFNVAWLRERFPTVEMVAAHELVLVFKVDAYPAGGDVRGVPVCSVPAP